MREKPNCAPDGDIYLIVVRDRVVLMDLADTVAEFDPRAVVLSRSSGAEAMAALRTHARLKLAFVEEGAGNVSRLGMDVAIAERGGKLILLGDDAESEWEAGDREALRWPLLMRPFSTQTVLRKIACAFAK